MHFDGPFEGWPSGPSLDLWFIDLAEEPSADESALLSADEQERAERLIIPSKRRQLIRARAAMRRVLGTYLGEDPATLRFEYGEQGKPRSSHAHAPTFNLSHSHEVGLLGLIASPNPLGIDIEHVRAGRAFDSIAEHFFSTSEASWFAQCSEVAREREFYRMWTHKEAYLKAIGTGLSFSSRGFSMDLDSPRVRVVTSEWPGDRPEIWRFTTLPCPSGYAAAACSSGPESTLRCFVAPGSRAEAFA